MHTACVKARYGYYRTRPQITSCALASGGGAAYLPARPHGREEAPTCGGDRRSRALANLHLHLEHEVDLDRVVEIRRTSAAGEMLLADAIEQACRRSLGRTKRSSCRLSHLRLPCGRSPTRRRG